jgi:excisionase family DNA binding protein
MTDGSQTSRVPTDATAGIQHLLRIADVAEILGVSTRTVKRLIASHALATIPIGRRSVRFRPSDIAAYIAHCAADPPSDRH